ncbi:MAG: hypothetical protein ACK4GJ_05275 [bacterium]
MIRKTLKILTLSIFLISISLFLVYSDNSKNTDKTSNLNNSKQSIQSIVYEKNYEKHYEKHYEKSSTKRKKIKDIEKNENFWNYLKSNHPSTFNFLQSIKDKHPRMYKKLLRICGRMYLNINETNNPDLKKLFAKQIDNQTNLTESIIKYKESKIKEEEFDTQAKEILRNIHQNNIKIMELRIQEMKNKLESKVEESLQKIKKEIKEETQ